MDERPISSGLILRTGACVYGMLVTLCNCLNKRLAVRVKFLTKTKVTLKQLLERIYIKFIKQAFLYNSEIYYWSTNLNSGYIYFLQLHTRTIFLCM